MGKTKKKQKGKSEPTSIKKSSDDLDISENKHDIEAQEIKSGAKEEALLYLKKWKKDRGNWSFKKVRQTWLLKNAYEKDKIPNKYFRYLLKYGKGLQGIARETTLKEAQRVRDETMDAADEDSTNKHQRAVDILKLLS